MNRINKKIIISVVLALVIIGGGVYLATTNKNADNKASSAQSANDNTKQSSDESNAKNTDNGASTGDSESSTTDHTPKQFESPPSSSNSSQSSNKITGVINYKHVSNNTLTLRNTIDQKLTSGICKLTLKNQSTGATITKQADVIANPSSSTCRGFSVGGLQKGTWTITIDITSGNSSGKLTSSVNV